MNYIMGSTYYKTLAFVVALLTTMTTWASKPELKFKKLDTRNGLSNSQVNCIMKDSKGFVWIGTKYGLDRYDGTRFRVFQSNTKDTTTTSTTSQRMPTETSGCSRKRDTASIIQRRNVSSAISCRGFRRLA